MSHGQQIRRRSTMTGREAAKIVLKIFASKHVRPGHMIMHGALERAFLMPEGKNVADLETGINWGIDQGWFEWVGDGLQLKRPGDVAMGQFGWH